MSFAADDTAPQLLSVALKRRQLSQLLFYNRQILGLANSI